ncbi:DUF397 domain-containing protein [Saccharopolyspora cebuensis]|uniref:DUF397 domain-containing protein n=1 Tax=Saccharopolyspora cebuensis TaxID=418759 RepID=A0ABV4CLN8_9PSEU
MYDITRWRKSSRSNGNGGMCVEVGFGRGIVGARDSKLGETSPVLTFDRERWTDFLTALKG